MTGVRRLLAPAAALLAMGLLTTMVVSGHLRESRQLVRFQPAGVMPEAPSEIDRVELRTATGRWVFVRGSDGWRAAQGGRVLSGSTASSLDDSIKFMHVSAPIRVMEEAETAPGGLREFGLDPPGYTAILYHGDTSVLAAEFGAPNPQKVLQYMKLQGRDQVYLMSRFIGQEWEKALREVPGGEAALRSGRVRRPAPDRRGAGAWAHAGGITGYASTIISRSTVR